MLRKQVKDDSHVSGLSSWIDSDTTFKKEGRNRIESPEINPRRMFTLSMTKEARIYNGEKTASSISGAGKTGELHVKE